MSSFHFLKVIYTSIGFKHAMAPLLMVNLISILSMTYLSMSNQHEILETKCYGYGIML